MTLNDLGRAAGFDTQPVQEKVMIICSGCSDFNEAANAAELKLRNNLWHEIQFIEIKVAAKTKVP